MNEEFVNEAQLADWLTDLRLPRIRDRLPELLDEAARQELSLRDLVVFLCRTELAGRRQSRALLRLKQARFPMVRELDDFDFEAQPSVNPDQLRDLGTARWVGHGENVLMPGPPGVGKTHLAIGLGRAAVQQDCSVRFVAAPVLVTTLVRAHRAEQWDACLQSLVKPQLLIIDEFGYLPVPAGAAHLLFQVIATRYERGSILLTSNQSLGDWGHVLGDPVVATAILDRLLHHSQVLTIRGESYRLREKRRSGLMAPTTPSEVTTTE